MPKTGIILSQQAVKMVKNHLDKNGLTQEDFADKVLHVTPRTLRNWLARKTAIDDARLEIMISYANVLANEFISTVKPNELQNALQESSCKYGLMLKDVEGIRKSVEYFEHGIDLRLKYLQIWNALPEMSSCYCHFGKAGGLSNLIKRNPCKFL